MINAAEKPTTIEYLLTKATKVVCGKPYLETPKYPICLASRTGRRQRPVNNKTLILQATLRYMRDMGAAQ